MSDDDKARPVSGEIMTEGARPSPARRPESEFSDAEYETVAGAQTAPVRTPAAEDASTPGMDFLRARQPSLARAIDGRSARGGPLFWALGLLLVGLAFWISGGHALVRQQVAAFAPSGQREPLRIGEVKSRVEKHNGRDVLFVEGQAENHGKSHLALPALEIIVAGNDGGNTRYSLGTRGAELAPGDRYSFSSRLEAPRNGVKSVSVTFQKGTR